MTPISYVCHCARRFASPLLREAHERHCQAPPQFAERQVWDTTRNFKKRADSRLKGRNAAHRARRGSNKRAA